MNRRILIVAILLPVLAAYADRPQDEPEDSSIQQGTNSVEAWENRRMPSDEEARQKKQSREERRLLLMERELKRIGVTEDEKAKINALQKVHTQKMSANAERIAAARNKLARLMDQGAPMEVIEAAIGEITDAQAEQLRILVYNRIEMERILGKEKYDAFMKNARKQFQKHGRRGGPPLPPRPQLPPAPGQSPSDPDPSGAPTPPEKPGS
jgi:hypothetical protein